MRNRVSLKNVRYGAYTSYLIVLSVVPLSVFGSKTAFGQDDEPIQPVPLETTLDERKVALGEKLFHDPRLSKNGRVSCASCHNLTEKGGADGLQYSVGVSGEEGAVNSPTVFNTAGHFIYFWDGRAETLEDQIDGPVSHPDEMATNWPAIVAKLKKDNEYSNLFNFIYQSPPTEQTIKDAIATFERSLNTPNAPFDQYLRGNEKAISPVAAQGYKYFKSFGCAACHQGQNIGGNMYQAFGVVGDYFKDRGTPMTKEDLGRYNVTGDDWDKHVFKVPSLRNIELTAPYFHDGSAKTLEEAVNIMAKYQVGRNLNEEEHNAIVEFLKTLTGEYKGKKLNEK